jgi:hypothetical protein
MSKFLPPKHKKNLLWLYGLQIAIFLGVFTLFFFSLGFTLPESFLSAFLTFLIFYLLFHFLTLPFFIFPQIKGAVYVPSADERIQTMIDLLKLKKGQIMTDLGSGDGRVLIAFAQKGIEAHGYELNPILVRRAKENIRQAGLEKKAFVHWQSFWDVDFSQFDAVTVYGIPYIMKELEKKLWGNLKKGAKIASNAFTFPNWKPKQNKNDVYLYQRV